jgi:osmotically-inducible protein OsmY
VWLKPSVSAPDLKSKIKAALKRSALIDAENITVDVTGSIAVLRGSVHSISEKEDAGSAVWLSPGINVVDNQLQVIQKELAF